MTIYRKGDPPPSGYREWHAWADVQQKSGLRQKKCFACKLWKFPQEMEFPEGKKPLCVVCVTDLATGMRGAR